MPLMMSVKIISLAVIPFNKCLQNLLGKFRNKNLAKEKLSTFQEDLAAFRFAYGEFWVLGSKLPMRNKDELTEQVGSEGY